MFFSQFASKKDKIWKVRQARPVCEFRGTYRYCSPNVHVCKEQGRNDDLFSMVYMLIEAHCGLPWQKERDKNKVANIKLNTSDKELLLTFPGNLNAVGILIKKT